MKYKIVKGYVSTFNGKEKTVWNVVDENDGFIMDTFSLKRDAKLWIYCHEWIKTRGPNNETPCHCPAGR
jgi:hypothetical protein